MMEGSIVKDRAPVHDIVMRREGIRSSMGGTEH
jgi:hypothetical protein